METIIKIEEFENGQPIFVKNDYAKNDYAEKFEYTEFFSNVGNSQGYSITTNKQIITFAIDNNTQCCENYGYFATNDSISEFIGAELLDVTLTNTALCTEKFEEILKKFHVDVNDEERTTETMFVNFETSKGILQFVAYNNHNGFYGHHARIQSQYLTAQKRL